MSSASDKESLSIRPVREEDVPLVLNFIRELAEYEKMADEVITTEENIHSSLFGKSPAAEGFIGWAGESAVAFAIIFSNYSTFKARPGMYLEDLFVKPEMRGLGYGKQMLRYLAKLAVKRNCVRLEWAVLDWNESAIDFYKSLGAVPMDEWTVYRLAGKSLTEFASKE